MGFSIKRKGRNEWYLDVRVYSKEDVLRKRETFKGSKIQAEERYIEIRSELKLQLNQKNGSLKLPQKQEHFADIVDLYLEKKGKISRSHRSKYERLRKELGNVLLIEFGDRFEAFIRFCRIYPSRYTGKVLSETSINRYIEIARAIFNMAVELEIVEKNPVSKVKFPKSRETPRDVILTPEQIQLLLDVIQKEAPHLLAIVQYSILVPARKSELVNFKKSDLDLINNAIRVRNGTTKNDAGCWKPIPPSLVKYFREIPAESEYLFYRFDKESGKYCPLGDFRKAWHRCLRIAGIDNFRFHDTRHIAATNLLDNGTPAHIVQEVAGWKTDMLRTYYHRSGKSSFHLVKFEKKAKNQYPYSPNGTN